MNFFGMRGKTKISTSNDSLYESTKPSTLFSGSLGSRTYYQTKNRKKNKFFTKSLWYDIDRDEVETDIKIKKAQSFDNLDRRFDDEYLSKSPESKSSFLNSKQNIQEPVNNRSLKKSVSLENLSWKGKSKGVITKVMISGPINLRKITEDDEQFPMSKSIQNIVDEINHNVCKVEEIDEKRLNTEEIHEENKPHKQIKIRRTRSLGNLRDNKGSLQRNRCVSVYPGIEIKNRTSLKLPPSNRNSKITTLSDNENENSETHYGEQETSMTIELGLDSENATIKDTNTHTNNNTDLSTAVENENPMHVTEVYTRSFSSSSNNQDSIKIIFENNGISSPSKSSSDSVDGQNDKQTDDIVLRKQIVGELGEYVSSDVSSFIYFII